MGSEPVYTSMKVQFGAQEDPLEFGKVRWSMRGRETGAKEKTGDKLKATKAIERQGVCRDHNNVRVQQHTCTTTNELGRRCNAYELGNGIVRSVSLAWWRGGEDELLLVSGGDFQEKGVEVGVFLWLEKCVVVSEDALNLD